MIIGMLVNDWREAYKKYYGEPRSNGAGSASWHSPGLCFDSVLLAICRVTVCTGAAVADGWNRSGAAVRSFLLIACAGFWDRPKSMSGSLSA